MRRIMSSAGADGRPHTTVVEAVIADSDRPGFRLTQHTAPLLRPLMSRTAARLWRDDIAYAERLYHLRDQATRASRAAATP